MIREYLMRTREPPAIFQPSAMTTYNPTKLLQQKFINMAYKHPQLLIGDKDECDKVDNGSDEQAMKTIDNYNKQNGSTSTFKLNIFNDSNDRDQISEPTTFNKNCHLIGNVKPNLIKTWEQLNGMPTTVDVIAYPKEINGKLDAPNEFINPSIYLSTSKYLLSNQTQLSTSQNDESFVIRRLPSQSGYFYDSIDNELVLTQDDEDRGISSLCELEHGGEAMAEYISLIDKKEKLCWSIDSCN